MMNQRDHDQWRSGRSRSDDQMGDSYGSNHDMQGRQFGGGQQGGNFNEGRQGRYGGGMSGPYDNQPGGYGRQSGQTGQSGSMGWRDSSSGMQRGRSSDYGSDDSLYDNDLPGGSDWRDDSRYGGSRRLPQERYMDSGSSGSYGGYRSSGDAGSMQGGLHQPEQHGQNQFDPDYHQWRSQQMRSLDEDYRHWRGERYKKFSDEFGEWRKNRGSSAGSSSPTGSTSSPMSSSTGGSDGSKSK